ncbi:MAG: hypothetical protein C5S49_01290 [Candidatus Methanogaster sp.]|nr:MAG: hypothetical protein C5S49_01290 [ANME-2 cluster archaeon]
MSAENSEKFLCPKCGKQELEELEWGLKCRNCGYEMRRMVTDKPWSMPRFIRLVSLLTIYLIPVIVYSLILLVICGYMLWDIYAMLGLIWEIPGEVLLSKMVLYIVLLLALLDFTDLISERFVVPLILEIIGAPIDDGMRDKRNYVVTVVTMSVILILMHTFHKLFEYKPPDTSNWDYPFVGYSLMTISFAVLIFACLFGAAAVLIAVGLWKMLDSKGDQPPIKP